MPRHLRTVVLAAVTSSILLLTGCANTARPAAGNKDLTDAAIPEKVSADTSITIGAPEVRVALKLSGQIDKLPFKVTWANVSGGPQCSEAFRAHSLDVCAAAEVPAIHAHWTGLDTELVAAAFRKDPLRHPTYEVGIAPGADIRTLADLRGKRIAYSPGQAQGALVLRILAKAGLTQDDVELVELPSTKDVYPTALAGHQVDAAPIGGVNIKRYLDKYAKDGARTIRHGLRDDPEHLWVPTESVGDPQKAAAIREFVRFWARAQVWIDEHPKEWIKGYYVKDQGLTAQDGAYLVEQAGHPDIPRDWTAAIERQQKTIDLLAKETGKEPFEAATLFDRRYETVAADALAGKGASS